MLKEFVLDTLMGESDSPALWGVCVCVIFLMAVICGCNLQRLCIFFKHEDLCVAL